MKFAIGQVLKHATNRLILHFLKILIIYWLFQNVGNIITVNKLYVNKFHHAVFQVVSLIYYAMEVQYFCSKISMSGSDNNDRRRYLWESKTSRS